MQKSNIEPLFGPEAPCAQSPQEWLELEEKLETVISKRASDSRKKQAAQPMVRRFCANCPTSAECFAIALSGGDGPEGKSDYTGIAGGALFHEGKVSVPFTELIRRTA
ncbi:hypothetical protein LT337_32935 (plasmid) [Mycolicibacterium fortuitum]|uniref:hypothetical protein n=1 Tax=Mycolicibacterium conceptionense TaxID=451644 RepID=UPI003204AEA5|nr:hypothetical protein LT337_32935 [Mycolicibacterium fortuitum]